MSTINNVPFDINRTPVEINKTPKNRGASPVFKSELIHPVSDKINFTERRRGKDRRRLKEQIKINSRLLGERRHSNSVPEEIAEVLTKEQSPGRFIDLEV